MQILTADQAASLLKDGDTLMIGGSGSGHAVPESLIEALERRFLAQGEPRRITSVHPVGLGDRGERGASRLAHAGLLKRVVCGTLVDSPALAQMALNKEVEAWTLPQGALSQLTREMAAGRPGLVSHVGLHTFVDPRNGGGLQGAPSDDELVSLIEIEGREWLFYKPFEVDVAFLRGTTADEDGNVSMEHEAVFADMLSMAQATRRNGGLVIVQVKRLARRGTLPAKTVKIPGMLVDAVVVEPDQPVTYQTAYDPAFTGELRIPLGGFPRLPLDERKIIARRLAMELRVGAVCNVGSGVCTGIGLVAAEEDVLHHIVLTNEQGLIGVGGFINISQNARKMVFGGTFTAGSLQVSCEGGQLQILKEGAHRKFVSKLQQVSYSGPYARERNQTTLFVTERAVFRAIEGALELIEIAPGIDLERDVLAHMAFRPVISPDLKLMDERLFRPEPMGLAAAMDAQSWPRHARLAGFAEGQR
jgi:propionate CoA-transferase